MGVSISVAVDFAVMAVALAGVVSCSYGCGCGCDCGYSAGRKLLCIVLFATYDVQLLVALSHQTDSRTAMLLSGEYAFELAERSGIGAISSMTGLDELPPLLRSCSLSTPISANHPELSYSPAVHVSLPPRHSVSGAMLSSAAVLGTVGNSGGEVASLTWAAGYT